MKQMLSLATLKVKNKEKVIFDVNFIDSNKYGRNQLLSTVIIGANGTGKSYLLAILSDIFRALENKIKNKDMNLRYSDYFISYYFNQDFYVIKIINKRNVKIEKNDHFIEISDLRLPQKILAVSYMVNDKFTYKAPDSDETDIYEYLGIRRTSNAAWTNSIARRISDAFIELSSKRESYYKIKELLAFLNFRPNITLTFEPSRKTLFTRNMTLKQLKARIRKLQGSEEYRSHAVKKYTDEDLNSLLAFINVVSKKRNIQLINDKKSLIYSINFVQDNDMINLSHDSKYLLRLIELQFLTSPKITLYKDEEFDFEYASSGEKHLLFTLINITSKIKQNSLVLIDEPELSLHPNWQMSYIDTIKRIFYDYSSCHFILATHSHYIVSDLEEDSSSIVVINSDEEKHTRTSQLINYSTYAWSAENILYNIFQVRTSRNFYFEMDLRNVINIIKEKSQDTVTLSKLIDKLKKYTFDINDPLNLILQDAERYLQNVKKVTKQN
jgi:predicted ATPase